MTVEKSMLLITSHREGVPTFRMMPLTNECPYSEVIYIPQAKALVIFHKHTVEGLHMVPALDGNGDPVRNPKAGPKDNPYKQERKLLTTPHESYIQHVPEIGDFVAMFAYNSEFDYKKFMADPVKPLIETPETPKIILPN